MCNTRQWLGFLHTDLSTSIFELLVQRLESQYKNLKSPSAPHPFPKSPWKCGSFGPKPNRLKWICFKASLSNIGVHRTGSVVVPKAQCKAAITLVSYPAFVLKDRLAFRKCRQSIQVDFRLGSCLRTLFLGIPRRCGATDYRIRAPSGC